MDQTLADVHQTLSYSAQKIYLKLLGLGVLCLGLGLLLTQMKGSSFGPRDQVMLVLTFIFGGVTTLYALLRTVFPGKPRLVISPEGLLLHIEWVKDILIPWREVQGVETVDITGRVRGQRVTFAGVTVVLVTRRFYDRHIHVNSWFLRGPGWDTNFVPAGAMVQVALHHEALPATAAELRMAVETRWRAFGGARAANP